MKIMKPVMPAPLIATALIISCFTGNIYAQEQARDQTRERIYGSQLMTQQERLEHRERMRTMQTNEQRETYRQEHHKKMQERAQERGVTIPDDPPPVPAWDQAVLAWGQVVQAVVLAAGDRVVEEC